ncbi:hypothetical protein MAPG_04502 [Magnaporthiopsis poae ATCC 64411]|uniref:Uncharacterized protein n=1 Tax=Magnaporthiopsis poae (strain ATCC 64411 / 73-15) TaxID=644358 RepID=A0A0C4DWW8_MAGP6|nr:hypothetical protein MAPG_04502 [Magnaporthiopsis poae ATCC 64411]
MQERTHEQYNPGTPAACRSGVRAMQVAATDCVPGGSRPAFVMMAARKGCDSSFVGTARTAQERTLAIKRFYTHRRSVRAVALPSSWRYFLCSPGHCLGCLGH